MKFGQMFAMRAAAGRSFSKATCLAGKPGSMAFACRLRRRRLHSWPYKWLRNRSNWFSNMSLQVFGSGRLSICAPSDGLFFLLRQRSAVAHGIGGFRALAPGRLSVGGKRNGDEAKNTFAQAGGRA